MNKEMKKNILIICIIMLFIHILGFIYQILTHLPTLSILLKELFILIFLIQFTVVRLEIKYFKLICYISNLIIIITSCIYMDFLSVIISILLILYIYNIQVKSENKGLNNSYVKNIKQNNKYKK